MSLGPRDLLALEPFAIRQNIWRQLAAATRNPRHAFRLPVVATACPQRRVRARTVVLRDADPDAARLTFFTDRRSGKVAGLAMDRRVSWCFYDRRHRVQLRAETRGSVHLCDETARIAWESLGTDARALFAVAPAPGTALENGMEDVRSLDPANGFENFHVVVCDVEEMDWLILAREGHRRVHFAPDQAGRWQGIPVAP